MPTPKIAFLGTGLMGAPMAANLLKAGYPLTVWNRTSSKASALKQQGATVAATPAQAVAGADIVFLILGDSPDVEAVLLGRGGVAQGAPKGALVVDCTTISPEAEIKFGAKFKPKGVAYLDAPVTGGQKGAIDGTLTFMVGGDAKTIEKASPVLLAMGKKIIHAGPLSYGQRLKMVNQIVCAVHLLAMAEGLAAAKRLGLDQRMARELLLSGAARSWTLEVYGEKIMNNDFTPGFSVKWQAKDVRIAEATLKKLKLGLPVLAAAREKLEEALAAGLGEEGVQAVYKLYTEKKKA